MRYLAFLAALLVVPASALGADGSGNSINGMWVSTPYPSLEASADKPIKLPVSVHNSEKTARIVDLSVNGIPDGWEASLRGDGRKIGAVFVGPEDKVDVDLQVTPAKTVKAGTYRFKLEGRTNGARHALPISLTVGEMPPARLTLEPEFPDLRGAPDSEFTFKIALKNESGRDSLIRLEASAPDGFQPTFTKEYGSQQITSVPVKADAEENVEVKIKPPQGAKAGEYKVRVVARAEDTEAATDLTMTVTGRPELSLTGPGDRISGRAVAGEETPLKLVLANTGTAPASEIELSASEPSGWKVEFDRKTIARIEPGEDVEVAAVITPSRQAVAGDYMVTLRANGDSVSDSSEFRITVATSTMWGAVGIGVIAAALVVLALAMVRFGRR